MLIVLQTLSRIITLAIIIAAISVFASCEKKEEHTAPAIYPRDSVALMTTYGVNTLISDSGVIKYRIVAERWEVNQNKQPSRWLFERGLFLEQFDEDFHIVTYIQADTAYFYDQQGVWELRGNVNVKTKQSLHFTSEELFWDERAHELYSNKFSRLVTPERTLQGSYFRSDDKMTRYRVTNSKGSFNSDDFDHELSGSPTTIDNDSTPSYNRKPATPMRKSLF